MKTTKKIKKLPPIHPGEVLKTVLADAGVTANAVALALRIPANWLTEIINGKRAITADTDLRLARYFGMSEGFFIGIQTDYELMKRKRAIGDKLKGIRPRAA